MSRRGKRKLNKPKKKPDNDQEEAESSDARNTCPRNWGKQHTACKPCAKKNYYRRVERPKDKCTQSQQYGGGQQSANSKGKA
jgi:hypothetical protein